MRIEVFTEGDVCLPYEGLEKGVVMRIARKVCRLLELNDVSLALILTDNRTIRKLNREYRGKDRSTDVISFAYRDEPFPDTGGREEMLGDIYISLVKTLSQAGKYGVSFREEFCRLLIHGVLHLIGYDHELSAEEEERMRTKEAELMASL